MEPKSVASFQQNLGEGVDPTGDHSYPAWNHLQPQEILIQSRLQ